MEQSAPFPMLLATADARIALGVAQGRDQTGEYRPGPASNPANTRRDVNTARRP